jgi:DNA-directed RNA polymerase subunit L
MTGPRPITENDIEAIREATRAAHEAIKDLKAAIREAKQVTEEMRSAATYAVTHGVNDAVELGLAAYSDEIGKAIHEATDEVYARFEQLTDTLLGESRRHRGEGPLAEYAKFLAEKRNEADVSPAYVPEMDR